ncbi:hypothetical protein LH435_09740 [Laribacter hongkongensis]|uniref:RCC1 domain-containing protein n=1 Tax=Laribacter hongkongensis TaxID=168471 RepID=UPI001EFE8C63|nr:hypothetical protein [Laribacter hongkongensis]MCG9074276.1 hypothetical protein [Laribacter hongkongensis]
MSQHKLTVDDGSGASVLASLNAALAALASASSGPDEPVDTFPCQLWADTKASVWKMRNAANDGWVTLGALDATDGLVGRLNGAKLAENSVGLGKLARGAAGKVLLGQGPDADPVYGEPLINVDSLADGSIPKRKLNPGVFRQVKGFPKRQNGDFLYAQQMVQLDDGSLLAWGVTGNQKLGLNHVDNVAVTPMKPLFNVPPPSGMTVKEFICTGPSTFVVMSNGWVYSCGLNGYGALGHGDTTARSVLTRIEFFVSNGISIDKVFAASDRKTQDAQSTFFVTATGNVYACGYNSYGQLGVGDTANRSLPTRIAGSISGVKHVSITGCYVSHAFLLTDTGLIYAAGYNGNGQLGLGDTTNRNAFTLVSNVNGVAQVEAHSGWKDSTSWDYSGCSVLRTVSGDVYACGHNAYGQLGVGDTTNRNAFAPVPGLTNIKTVGVSGGFYAYMWAVSASGRLYVWGYNGHGVVGDGTSVQRTSPYNVTGWSGNVSQDPPFTGKIVKVEPSNSSYGGHSHLIVLDTDGKLWFSGYDYQCYCGDTVLLRNRFTPFLPFSLSSPDEKIIDMQNNGYDGTYRLFCLSSDKSLYAIGDNTYGVCLGGYASQSIPSAVKSLQRVPL